MEREGLETGIKRNQEKDSSITKTRTLIRTVVKALTIIGKLRRDRYYGKTRGETKGKARREPSLRNESGNP